MASARRTRRLTNNFPTIEKKKGKKEKGLLPVLDPLQTSESHTSAPWKEEDGLFAGLSGHGRAGGEEVGWWWLERDGGESRSRWE